MGASQRRIPRPYSCIPFLALLHEWRANAVLTLHNFGEGPHEARFRLKREDGDRLSDLMKVKELHAGDGNTYRIPLDALDYRWFRVGGLDYAVKRRRVK
jgi:maltose alpha-D-glucosyltransferase/alpha-amylase